MNTWVLNFSNSIVGVGVLAIPFCFHVCGIGIAAIMVLATNVLTRTTCEYLLMSGQITRKSGYETLAGHLLGPFGKLITELGIIGLMLGTLISFQVVIGDLAPVLISNYLGFPETWGLRATLMLLSSIGVIPLGLMRNISSLANMNALSMGFYCIFIAVVVLVSMKNLFSGVWMSQVNFWRPEGIFHCLPIISLSFSCQTQVFLMYEAIPEPSIKSMMNIINKAINLVTVMYLLVGFFGYVAFYETGIRGDILANFPTGLLSNGIKTGFWISIVVSFPLIIFPLRMAIHSLLFSREKKAQHEIISSAADFIPQNRFTSITLALIGATLVIGILIPHIETVLSITGAAIGTFLCFVFPAGLYIMSSSRAGNSNTVAKFVFVLSVICMLASSFAVLSGGHASDQAEHKGHPGHDDLADEQAIKIAQPFQTPDMLHDIDKVAKMIDKMAAGKADAPALPMNAQPIQAQNVRQDQSSKEEVAKDRLEKQVEQPAKETGKHDAKKEAVFEKDDAVAKAADVIAKQSRVTEKGDARKLQQVSNESQNDQQKEKASNGLASVQEEAVDRSNRSVQTGHVDQPTQSTTNGAPVKKISEKVKETKTAKTEVQERKKTALSNAVEGKEDREKRAVL